MEEIHFSCTIEVKGLTCPLPLYRTKKKLAMLSLGSILKINGIDKEYFNDFVVWCDRNNHNILEKKEILGQLTLFIKRG